MIIQVPEKVDYIINQLMENGYEAYAVGGCVRDSILNRIPGDWDITTSASPYEVKQIFPRTIDTGIQHGTVTVMLDKEGFEVTTYRLDGEYEDCRHPKQVEFTKNLTEDLKRRDFTINAMAYNHQEGMVDRFEGLEDIERKVIRCVGSAMDRFEEDALRILRAVRFAAQLDFAIEESTKEAIVAKAKNLRNISAERIREELNKLLLSKHPDRIITAYETGITQVVLPEFDAFKQKELLLAQLIEVAKIAEAEFEMLDAKSMTVTRRKLTAKERLSLSYALLLQPLSEDGMTRGVAGSVALSEEQSEEAALRAKKVMQRLRFDNDTIQMVTRLVRFQARQIKKDPISMRQSMNAMGLDLMDVWFLMKQLELNGILKGNQKAEQVVSQEALDERQNWLSTIRNYYDQSVQAKDCVNLKMLKITGKELIALGYQPGVGLGVALEELLQEVIKDPRKNEPSALLMSARAKLGE